MAYPLLHQDISQVHTHLVRHGYRCTFNSPERKVYDTPQVRRRKVELILDIMSGRVQEAQTRTHDNTKSRALPKLKKIREI